MKLLSVLLAVGIPAGCILHKRFTTPPWVEVVNQEQQWEEQEWAGFRPASLESGPLPACECPDAKDRGNGNTLWFSLSDDVEEALVWVVDTATGRCLGSCYVRCADTAVIKGLPDGTFRLEGACNGELLMRESGGTCEYRLKGAVMAAGREYVVISPTEFLGYTLPFEGGYTLDTYFVFSGP